MNDSDYQCGFGMGRKNCKTAVVQLLFEQHANNQNTHMTEMNCYRESESLMSAFEFLNTPKRLKNGGKENKVKH